MLVDSHSLFNDALNSGAGLKIRQTRHEEKGACEYQVWVKRGLHVVVLDMNMGVRRFFSRGG